VADPRLLWLLVLAAALAAGLLAAGARLGARWSDRVRDRRWPVRPMDDLTYWTRALRQAEAELEAATTRAAINAAAKRVMLAKAELKRSSGRHLLAGGPV
jgi:hypothetical protein